MPVIPFGAPVQIAKRVTGVRVDPYMAYNFHVEADGLVIGGFTDVSGLTQEVEIKRQPVGGRNDSDVILPVKAKQTDLVLSRGMTDLDMFYGWFLQVQQLIAVKKSLTIYLLDDRSAPITWWDVSNAMPIRWDGPTLNSTTNAVAVEKITLAHEGVSRAGAARLLGAVRSGVSAAQSVL